jgi:hypothetical protein
MGTTNSLKASIAGLAMVDQARQRRGWTKTSTARWWQDAHTSRATLRRFWQGERIQHDIFIALCQAVGINQWQQVADLQSPSEEPAEPTELSQSPLYDLDEAPNVEAFYGRNQELSTLITWTVADRCRLLTIVGMGGIGKTALALALVDSIGENQEARSSPFDRILWRSLQAAPTLLQLLDSLLHAFSTEQTLHIAHDLPTGIAQLLQYLREQRCLLILDGLEAILAHRNTYRAGYEEYGDFLLRLSRDRHQSCILLTSREKPPGLISDDKNVRCLTLRGLPATAALELLQSQSFKGQELGLQALIRLYGGNPLALKVMAPLVQDLFGGNVLAYLNQNTVMMGSRLRAVLKQQLDRLPALERSIVYWLAICQEPIAFCRLQSQLLYAPDPATTLESLASLEGRSLLEKLFNYTEPLFTLQPFVMKAVRDELIEQASQELQQAIQTNQIGHFQVIRTHCLLRPGTDDIAGDLILTQLRDNLLALGGDLLRSLNGLLPLFQESSPSIVGYAAHNVTALLRLLT